MVLRVGFHLGARSCDAMYRMRESKSKLELFYRLFVEFFVIRFLALGLNTRLNGVWNYCYLYQSDLTSFKRRSDFLSSLGYLRHLWTRDTWRYMASHERAPKWKPTRNTTHVFLIFVTSREKINANFLAFPSVNLFLKFGSVVTTYNSH